MTLAQIENDRKFDGTDVFTIPATKLDCDNNENQLGFKINQPRFEIFGNCSSFIVFEFSYDAVLKFCTLRDFVFKFCSVLIQLFSKMRHLYVNGRPIRNKFTVCCLQIVPVPCECSLSVSSFYPTPHTALLAS